MKLFKFSLLIVALGSFVSCENGPVDPGNVDDFDRKAMLTHWVDNIIVPAYTDFAGKTSALKQAGDQFANEPGQTNLENLRSAWLDAYKAWQSVSMFAIGKAESNSLREYLNIYPTDVDELKENVVQGNYNLALPSEFDQQGFPALDYLIYGLGASDPEILAFYTTDANADAYKTYVADLVNRIDALTQEVLTDWPSGYRDEFINNSGNSANASVDRLVNDYIFYYEKYLRAGKVGIPAGVFSGSSLPTHVEAIYKGEISKELLLLALDAVQDFFNGKHFGSDETGESLKSYLDYLSTSKDGEQLSLFINSQFEAARSEIQGLSDNLKEQVETDNFKMLSAYDQLQLNVVLLKVDMLQALNINVDFVDADGD